MNTTEYNKMNAHNRWTFFVDVIHNIPQNATMHVFRIR